MEVEEEDEEEKEIYIIQLSESGGCDVEVNGFSTEGTAHEVKPDQITNQRQLAIWGKVRAEVN